MGGDVAALGVRVLGGPGTGKTSALLARHARLAAERGASQVLAVLPDRAAARRYRDALLPALAGGFDSLPVTTPYGLAFDVVSRWSDRPVVLLQAGERAALIASLLAGEGPAEWPTLAPLSRGGAFAAAVGDALAALDGAGLADDEVMARAAAAGCGERWAELLAFRRRYRARLAADGVVDAPGLLARATELLSVGADGVAAWTTERFSAVLVDDAHLLGCRPARLVAAVLAAVGDAVVAADPGAPPAEPGAGLAALGVGGGSDTVELGEPFLGAPPPPELVTGRHPALEAEAVAAELLAASAGGVPWREMAVLVRRPGARSRSVARALARHGIPVTTDGGAGGAAEEPAVRAIVDVLRWAAGDDEALGRLIASPLSGLDPAEVRAVRRRARAAEEPLAAQPELAPLLALRADLRARLGTDDPAGLAFEVWRRALAPAMAGDREGRPADERSLDAVVSLFDGLQRFANRHPAARLVDWLAALPPGGLTVAPGGWRPSAGSPDAVTVTGVQAAAGRRWGVVVVPGCVEGEWPSPAPPARFFDTELLGPAAEPAGVGERRARALAAERHLFAFALSRATARVVLTAAPPPGVLRSRFVDDLPSRPASLVPVTGEAARPYPPLPVTPGVAPAWPDGRLRLSATQLETYADCPKRYGYQYVLHLPRASGAAADLGSLVHRVLAEFCDPASAGERTREALLALAEAHWRDDLARYRPQVEELRRDYYAMLDAWWEDEGQHGVDVVAVEHRFDVEVGPHRVTGAIDRVDRLPGGGLRILDYKTGKTEPTADEVAANMQLATYHLAARRDPELSALGEPEELSLLFVRSMKRFGQDSAGPGHEADTEARILATAEQMLAEEFEPLVTATCDYCHLQRLCPLWPEGREVGAP